MTGQDKEKFLIWCQCCFPGQRWIPTATKRKEPKEGNWLNVLTVSSMEESPRCNQTTRSCTISPSPMGAKENQRKSQRERGRRSQRESQKAAFVWVQYWLIRNFLGSTKNAIWGLRYLKDAQVKSQFDGPGLLLDFHGQTHAGDRTELGYGISSETATLDLS